MSLTGLGLDGLLGLGGSAGQNTTGIQNAAQQNITALPPGSVWVTTTNNTSAGQQLSGLQGGGAQGIGPQNPSMYGLMQETQKMLEEVREDLLPLKKWLIATYPDIYKQYVAVEEIRKASND